MSPQAGNYLSPTISDPGMVRNDYKLILSGFKTPLFLGASLCPALPAALFCARNQCGTGMVLPGISSLITEHCAAVNVRPQEGISRVSQSQPVLPQR